MSEEKIAGKKGEWLERYVFRLLQLAGFEVKFHKLISGKGGIKHEIDLFVETDDGLKIAVECKDRRSGEKIKKMEFDAFIAKVKEINVDYGLFVISQIDKGEYRKYRKYLDVHGIRFIDGTTLEKLWDKLLQLKDAEKFASWLKSYLNLKKRKRSLLTRILEKITFSR